MLARRLGEKDFGRQRSRETMVGSSPAQSVSYRGKIRSKAEMPIRRSQDEEGDWILESDVITLHDL